MSDIIKISKGAKIKAQTSVSKRRVNLADNNVVTQDMLRDSVVTRSKIVTDPVGRTIDQVANAEDYVLEPTTNTTWASTSSNNPRGLYFDDCKARFGVERINIVDLVEATDIDGPGGAWYAVTNNGIDKRIVFRGYARWNKPGENIGMSEPDLYTTEISTASVEITGVYSAVRLLYLGSNNRHTNNSVYLDGGSIGAVSTYLSANDSIISGKGYASYTQKNIISTTLGIHTAKIIAGTDQTVFDLEGFELVCDRVGVGQEVSIAAGYEVVNGQKVWFSAKTGSSALNYKGNAADSTNEQYVSGSDLDKSKGGRIAWYRKEDGTYISKVQTVDNTQQSGTATDGSPDYIAGLSDNTQFYTVGTSVPNIVRVRRTSDQAQIIVAPSGISGGNLQFAVTPNGTGGSNTVLSGVIGAANVTRYCRCLTNADHTDEEAYRTVFWRECGWGRSDDFFRMIPAGATTNAGWTLSDGSTSLGVTNGGADSSGFGLTCATNSSVQFVFFGTGIDMLLAGAGASTRLAYVVIDGVYLSNSQFTLNGGERILKLASDLPVGFHSVRLASAGANVVDRILGFRLYQPKTKAYANYQKKLAYNIMADFVASPRSYNGIHEELIEQGMVRTYCKRHFRYSAGGALTYGSYDPSVYSPHINQGGGAASLSGYYSVFGSTYYRMGIWGGLATNTVDLYVDSVLKATVAYGTPVAIHYPATRSDMGATGNHELRVSSNTITAGMYIGWFEYWTPVYEPQGARYNINNEAWLLSTGIGNYAYTLREKENLKQAWTVTFPVSSSPSVATNVPTTIPEMVVSFYSDGKRPTTIMADVDSNNSGGGSNVIELWIDSRYVIYTNVRSGGASYDVQCTHNKAYMLTEGWHSAWMTFRNAGGGTVTSPGYIRVLFARN